MVYARFADANAARIGTSTTNVYDEIRKRAAQTYVWHTAGLDEGLVSSASKEAVIGGPPYAASRAVIKLE